MPIASAPRALLCSLAMIRRELRDAAKRLDVGAARPPGSTPSQISATRVRIAGGFARRFRAAPACTIFRSVAQRRLAHAQPEHRRALRGRLAGDDDRFGAIDRVERGAVERRASPAAGSPARQSRFVTPERCERRAAARRLLRWSAGRRRSRRRSPGRAPRSRRESPWPTG